MSSLLCCDAAENPLLATQQSRQLVVKFANQNKRFYNNLFLALAVATYVTLFGLPVYSSYVSWVIFGEKHRWVIDATEPDGGHFVSVCGDNMMGPKVNAQINPHNTTPVLVTLNSTFIAQHAQIYAWCGFLPASYFAAWPSVVQTAIFTIFMNTGSTVKLAWQCIAGTFSAVLNIYLLTLLFPLGAASSDYNAIVAWADLVLVLALYLASKADTNTMMMGMNWTVCLMLHFMDPHTGSTLGSYKTFIPFVNWDGETTVVMLTSIMGCILAIICTVFPMPLLNIRRVHDDAKEVTNAIDNIFQDAIEYWAGSDMGPKRFQVFGKMKALSAAVKRVKGNLDDSFWETFNLGSYGRMRSLYSEYNSAIQRNDDEIYMVKAALETLNFDDNHNKFVTTVKEPLFALKTAAIDCLRICAHCCKDGTITADEKEGIEQALKVMEDKQQDLSNQFQIAKKGFAYLSTDLAADSLLVFSVSQWAREIGDFGSDLTKFEATWQENKYSNPFQGLCGMACGQLANIFDPREMVKEEQIRFTLMNGIPIIITYVLAMQMDVSVFQHYSAVMPGTLTLLVTYDYGATFFKNLQRLMGVTLGLTLPLLVMSLLSIFPCESNVRFVLHVMSLFLFNFMFTFMYYSSDQWATIGVCIAGFGVYPMFHQCDNSDVPHYAAQYKHIAQVIIAILLKMFVAHLLSPQEPRDDALTSLDKLSQSIKDAYHGFITGDIDGEKGLKASRDNVKKYLGDCETNYPKCDPSLQIVPGTRTPFKHELYGYALHQFRLVLSDLDMLTLAMTGHEQVHSEVVKVNVSAAEKIDEHREEAKKEEQEKALHAILDEQEAWKQISTDLMTTIENVLDLLKTVLAHDTEEPLEADAVERLKSMDRVMELQGVPEFYSEVGASLGKSDIKDADIFEDKRIITQLKRTRLNVAVNSLSLAVKHIGMISAQCFNNMIYT